MENTSRALLVIDAPDSQASETRKPLALVLCGDPPTHLEKATSVRSGMALPFAGKYRLIDFALANCANSGIERIGVIVQHRPHSSHAHPEHGHPLRLRRRERGLTLLHSRGARPGTDLYPGLGWHVGSADAVFQNRAFISGRQADEVLILSGCEVFCTDLSALIAQHRQGKADLTIAAVAVQGKVAGGHNTLVVDSEGHVRVLVSPGSAAPGPWAAMGAMLFSADVLSRRLSEDAQQPGSMHELIHDVIPRMLAAGDRVMAFQHAGYWKSLETAHDYWQAHMDLLSEVPGLNLQDAARPIRARSDIQPPTRISASARISHSMICDGCIIEGTVEHSVLSPGVHVAPGAVVRHAVVMAGATIEERALVENVILGVGVVVGSQAHVGRIHRHAPTCQALVPDQLIVTEQGGRISTRTIVGPDFSGPDSASSEWFRPAQRQDASRDVVFWTERKTYGRELEDEHA